MSGMWLFGSLFAESVALGPLGGALHPGGRAGVEVQWNHAEAKVAVVQGLHVSAWSHPGLHDAGALVTEISARPRFGRLGLEGAIGVGALLTSPDAERFGGTRGDPTPIGWDLDAALTAALGLDVRVIDRVSAFARYEVLAEGPFGLLGNPVLPHRNAHVGVRVALGGAQ